MCRLAADQQAPHLHAKIATLLPGFGATLLLAVPAPAPSVRCGRECSRSLCSRALGARRRRRRVRGEIFPAWGSDRLLCRASESSSLRDTGLARPQTARLDRFGYPI